MVSEMSQAPRRCATRAAHKSCRSIPHIPVNVHVPFLVSLLTCTFSCLLTDADVGLAKIMQCLRCSHVRATLPLNLWRNTTLRGRYEFVRRVFKILERVAMALLLPSLSTKRRHLDPSQMGDGVPQSRNSVAMMLKCGGQSLIVFLTAAFLRYSCISVRVRTPLRSVDMQRCVLREKRCRMYCSP